MAAKLEANISSVVINVDVEMLGQGPALESMVLELGK